MKRSLLLLIILWSLLTPVTSQAAIPQVRRTTPPQRTTAAAATPARLPEAELLNKVLPNGLEVIAGRGFVFEGMWHQTYLVTYTRRPDCPAHEADEPVEELSWRVAETPAGFQLE